MRLAELPVGTSILFDVSIQKQELEFPSEVVEVHDNFILTKPVMSKGKVVGLGEVFPWPDLFRNKRRRCMEGCRMFGCKNQRQGFV